MKRLMLVGLVVGTLGLSVGCDWRKAYLSAKAEYIVFKDTIKIQCANGEIEAGRCTLLAAADKRLVALDKTVKAVDSTRAEVKAALEQLELVVEQQKDALAGN